MNNSQIDRDKPEVSIPDLIAKARQRVPKVPRESMSNQERLIADMADALESVTAPSDTDRDLLAVGLAKYGPEWWTPDDIQHMVSNLTELDDLDRGSIAHEMWTMGAWLKHPKCRNNPKRGNDADYENECAVCEQYLLVVADAILGLRPSQPVQVEVTEASVKILAKHMANAASDWNHDDCDDDDHSLEHSNWEAYTGDALRALSAALTPTPAVPAPEVIPGTRAALDGLSIRTTERGK